MTFLVGSVQAKGAVSKVQNAVGDNAGLFDKKPSAQEVSRLGSVKEVLRELHLVLWSLSSLCITHKTYSCSTLVALCYAQRFAVAV